MYVSASALFIGSLVAHAPGVVVVLQYPWQIDLLKVVRLLHVMSTPNHLFFVPLPVLVDVFLGTSRADVQTS